MPQRIDDIDARIAALVTQAEATNKRLDTMDNRLDNMDSRLDNMDSRLDNMDSRLDNIESDVSDIKRDIDGLGASFRREVRAQSSYRGNYAQRATIMSNQDIARRFAHLHNMHRIEAVQVSRASSRDWLANNIPVVEKLGLRERAWDTFLVPDDIAGVIPLGANSDATPTFYIVVESSYTIQEEDISKATDHARIVQAVTGIDAYPVVAGAELDDRMDEETRRKLYDDADRFIESADPDSAYLYWLDSADMRPHEPR